MKELNLDERKNRLLSILIELDKVCKRNNIFYSLAYGTLLGAVRHKGFIPWDDDVDIMMTRENYEKFISLKNSLNNSGYQILDNTDKNYNSMFAKFVDSSTILVPTTPQRYEQHLGLYIDVFPIDYLDNSFSKSEKIFKKIKFKHALLVSAQWKKYTVNKFYSLKRQIIRFVFFVLSRFVKSKKLIQKLKKFETNKTCLYMGSLYGSLTNAEIFDSIWFSRYKKLKFCNIEFPVIADYDLYLKKIYGNYMELPPVEQRINPHDFNCFSIE